MEYPFEGARFLRDPGVVAAAQAVVFRVRASAGAGSMSYFVDGRRVGSSGPPYSLSWPLATGEHRLHVETAGGRASAPVRFVVE